MAITEDDIVNFDSMSDEEFLEHYGIRGMKWGVRRGKSVTGVGRLRGSMMERNERSIMRISEANQRTGRIRNRVKWAAARLVLGSKRVDRYSKTSIKKLKEQNKRLKKGEETLVDRLSGVARFRVTDVVVSVKTKKKY